MQTSQSPREVYRGEGKYIRKTGGVGSHGHVVIELEPISTKTVEFANGTIGGVIPKQFMSSIEMGIREAIQDGFLMQAPIIAVKITLVDGSYHEVDSSPNDFKIAAKLALKDACAHAPMTIMEPLAEVEVSRIPEEFIGAVVGDLNKRRGRIASVDTSMVKALVPVAEMFGYSTDLRSLTQGRADFFMALEGYEEVPQHIQANLIAEAGGHTA